MPILFNWTQRFPGIDLIDIQIKENFINFVQTNYSDKLKKSFPHSALAMTNPGWSSINDNQTKLYEEIIRTPEYKTLRNAIHNAFFDDLKKDLKQHLNKKIIGFKLASEQEQDQFIRALISDFSENMDVSMKLDAFKDYVDICFEPGLLAAASISKNEHYKKLKKSIDRKMIQSLRENIKFLFILPINDDETLLQFANIVYDTTLTVEAKTTRLIELFENDDKIKIQNIFPMTPAYEVFSKEQQYKNIKTFLYDSTARLYHLFFSHQIVQEYASSQAFWHKMGFIPEAHTNSLTEAANVAFINSHSDLAWRFRRFFVAVQAPLVPLYKEWFEVIPEEPNNALALARFIIPIVIAGVIIALIFSLVSSWVAMPAIFELLMIVPATYMGFVVASACIAGRNFLYEKYQSWFQIDEYDASTFQVNQFLQSVFAEFEGSMTQTIREYYVGELKKCDKISNDIEWSHNQCLPTQRNDYKKEMLKRRSELLDEWKKLRNPNGNHPASTEELQLLVKKRVYEDLHHERPIDKQNRADYLKKYCRTMENHSVPLKAKHTFFSTQPTIKKNFEENQKQMERLQTIGTELHRAKP